MPDRDKVRTGLQCIIDGTVRCENCGYAIDKHGHHSCQQECALDALTMLREQEAKQVIRKQCKKEHNDGSIDYFAEWYCPHCNMLILRGFGNPSIEFCYKCGKPILWEGR